MKYVVTVLAALCMAHSASALEWFSYEQTETKVAGTCKAEFNTHVIFPDELKKDNPDEKKVASQQVITEKMNKILNALVEPLKQWVVFAPEECIPNRGRELFVQSDVSARYLSNTWASFEHAESSYMGGAHGNSSVTYVVIAANGDLVPFSSVLAVSKKQFIETVIVKIKEQDRYWEDDFKFWSDRFMSGEYDLNYYANEQGIVVTFNAYAIGPYAAGPTTIRYYWEELKPLLKKNSIFAEYLK